MKKRMLGLAAATAFAVAAIAAPASAANSKEIYLGPDFNWSCGPVVVFDGDPLQVGFANINYVPRAGKIEAQVAVKGLEPNTTYRVRLTQGLADCFTVDARFTTDDDGNGNVHVREAIVDGSPGVILAINNDASPNSQPWYGTERVDAPA